MDNLTATIVEVEKKMGKKLEEMDRENEKLRTLISEHANRTSEFATRITALEGLNQRNIDYNILTIL